MSGSQDDDDDNDVNVRSCALEEQNKILEMVYVAIENDIRRSTLFDNAKEACIPRFDSNEILLGRIVGKGGFCVVHAVNDIKLLKKNNCNDDDETITSKTSTSTTSSRRQRRIFNSLRLDFFGLHHQLLKCRHKDSTTASTTKVEVEDISSSREYLAQHAENGGKKTKRY